MGLLDTEILKPPFHAVPNVDEQLTLLYEAVQTPFALTLWTKKREHVVDDAILRSYSPSLGLEIEAPRGSKTKKLIEFLKEKDSVCYVNFGTFVCGVFFSSRFDLERESEKRTLLAFHYPEEFFKVQRRATVRLPIRPPYLLLVEFTPEGVNHPIQRKALDISPGGLAILTRPNDSMFFSKGNSISSIQFTVRDRKFKLPVEVRHSRLVTEDKLPQLLVGMRFTSIEKADEEFLANYVNEEMRTQFVSFMK